MSTILRNKTKFVILFVSNHYIVRIMRFIVLLSPSYQMSRSYVEIDHNCLLKILIRLLPSSFQLV
jgi:hypothetical protein